MQINGIGFCLALALRWTTVSLHPLSLENRGYDGIHQRQPNYMPTYNGIFSINALNYTSPMADTAGFQQHHLVANNNSSTDTDDSSGERPSPPEHQEDTLLFPEDGTAVNEVDSEDRPKVQELTTFPQLHVVTQTIGDVTGGWERTDTDTDTDATEGQTETTTEPDQTGSETLLEGTEDTEDTEDKPGEDIFDRLMRTIQGHWLDFVSKMKLSVLDVWKSISHHMMQRLESFATAL